MRMLQVGASHAPNGQIALPKCTSGLGESKFCGCLQAVMLHEVAHYFGYEHSGGKNAYDIEKPCFKCAGERP